MFVGDKLVVVVWRHGFQLNSLTNFVINLKTYNICTLQHLLSFKSFRNLEQQAHSYEVDSRFPFIQNMTIQAFEEIFKTRNMKRRYGHNLHKSKLCYGTLHMKYYKQTWDKWNLTNLNSDQENVGSKFGAKKSGTHMVQNCSIQNLAVETWNWNLGNPTIFGTHISLCFCWQMLILGASQIRPKRYADKGKTYPTQTWQKCT
jgi:hypothetical protein